MAGGAAAVGLGAAASQALPARASAAQQRLIDTALGAATANAQLSDVKHVVILMQENRSFDHYFGTLSGVRGFSDPDVLQQAVGGIKYPVFDQFGYQPGTGVDASGYTSTTTRPACSGSARCPTSLPTTTRCPSPAWN
jgi:phospholipase C